jgi:hypothetical protein
LAKSAHIIDYLCRVIGASCSRAGVLRRALQGASSCWALLHTIPLRCQIIDILEVDERGICLLVVARISCVVNWEINLEVIFYVRLVVLCVKIKKDRTNKVTAKAAGRIVQKQSVHFLSFSSTGKFRNVYTLFLNIYR